MNEHNGVRAIRIATGHPWKEAVISLLAPGSPYHPWSTDEDIEPGDPILVIVDTDPVSVFSEVGVVGPTVTSTLQ